MTEVEVWKKVKGLETSYEISNLGRLRNKNFYIIPPVLRKNRNNYIYFIKSRRKSISILVAEHFIPNPDNSKTVNHKNGDIKDNRASNLEWENSKVKLKLFINKLKEKYDEKFIDKLDFSNTIFTDWDTEFTLYHKEWNEYITIIPYSLYGQGINKRRLSESYNLKIFFPEIASEWHPTKNGDLKPEQFTPNSDKKVWWKCEKGHEWNININHRTGKDKTGCPHCTNRHTSIPEQTIYYYLMKIDPSFENRKKVNGFEFDIYSEKLKLAIEYDGERWHKNEENIQRDNKKNNSIPPDIKLIRIREYGCPELSENNNVLVHTLNKQKHLESGFNFIKEYILSNIIDITEKARINNIKIDLKKDHTEIQNFIKRVKVEKSIATTHPHLLLEWDYELNGATKPEHLKKGSGEKVYWKCLAGLDHPSYQTVVSNRCIKNQGCPKCGNIKISMSKYKKIIQMDLNNNDIKEFESIKKASKELNISKSAIGTVLNGKQKSTHNFKFKYK